MTFIPAYSKQVYIFQVHLRTRVHVKFTILIAAKANKRPLNLFGQKINIVPGLCFGKSASLYRDHSKKKSGLSPESYC